MTTRFECNSNLEPPPHETTLRAFDPWGYVLNYQQVADNGNRLKYCGALGHPSVNTTGLVYMRARYYDPLLGRAISEDPAKNGGNWYAYAGNNPIGNVDPDGRRFLGGDQIMAMALRFIASSGREAAAVMLRRLANEWEQKAGRTFIQGTAVAGTAEAEAAVGGSLNPKNDGEWVYVGNSFEKSIMYEFAAVTAREIAALIENGQL